MSQGKVVASGHYSIGLPSWGRCFWQDPNDGVLFLAYASGNTEVDFVTSADSGLTWSGPKVAFYVDNFTQHPNFDIAMDRNGDLHCGFRYQNYNCYAHLVKNGTTWDQESPIQRPWSICADSGSVGGHNGSVYVHEINDFYTVNTLSFTPPGFRATPQVFLVAKAGKDGGGLTAIKAARILSPFTSAPASGYFNSDVSDIASGIPPGLDGGFPTLTAAGKPANFGGGSFAYHKQVVYSVDTTGIVVSWNDEYDTFGRVWQNRRIIELFEENDAIDDVFNSGFIPEVIPGPSMGFEKGPYPFEPVNPIIVSTNEEYLGSFFDKHWDMFTSAHEHITQESFGIDKFVRVESSAQVQGGGELSRSLNYNEWADDVFRGGQPSNVAPALAPFSGTLCDITNGAQSGLMYMYFNSRASDGRHCVSRMLCEVEPQPQTGGPTKIIPTTYRFPDRFHPVSGIRNFAFVDTTLAGGKDGKGMWDGMRALHHVNGQWAAGKSEFVATVGSGLGPRINRLIAWDFNSSLEATAGLKLPTFSFDHITASGTNSTFVGLIAASIASSPSTVHNLFDQSTVTSQTISNGDSLTFEWNTPVIISRIEIPWNKTGFGSSDSTNMFEIEIQTSMDGINFETVKYYDGVPGREGFSTGDFLVKVYADTDLTIDEFNFTTRMDCGIGRFLRIRFTGPQTGTRDVREVRIYGASTTEGKVSTDFNSFLRTFSRPTQRTDYVEKFDGVFEFSSLPPGWRSYGDWDWFVQASGELSKPTKLPSAQPTRLGLVQSGIFAGRPVGSGDGSALSTAEWMPLNSSGVVEVDINVGVDELDKDGNPGRTIRWDTRYHKIGKGLIIPATSDDDSFQFFVVPSGKDASLNMGEVKDFHTQGNCYVGTCDYFTVSTNVPPGEWTLRWAFRRGKTPNAIPIAGDQSLAFIDNVRGLDAPTQPSIFGYMSAESFATGVIYGYMAKTDWSYINSYMKAYYWFEPRHGYIFGAPNAFEGINGYLLGNKEGQVLGYTLGGSGLLSIPSGSINGYVAVQSGNLSAINGYALGMRAEQIYGYMTSTSGVNSGSGIFGYMMVPDAASMIYGGVNLGVSGVPTDNILGFLANRANENTFGFVLGPSGALSNINGYMAPQNAGTILGYVSALASQTGDINGYVKVADEENNIFGYLISSGDPLLGPQQRINGYLLNDGVAEQIYGYMNVIDTENIYGYTKGAEFASGSINAYISGVGFAEEQVLGYLAGISGTASGSINSYLVGVEGPSKSILGWMVGIPDAANSCEACTPNHGNVPLPPAVTALTLPSSCFNI